MVLGGVLDVPVGILFLGHDNHLPRLEAGDGDEPVAVGGVPAVVGADGCTVLVGDMEHRAGQRLLAGALLEDGQGAVPLVPEGEALHLATFNENGLRGPIQNEAFHGLDFAGDDSSSRFDAGQDDLACFIRIVKAKQK